MTSAFFLPYTILQIPAGYVADRRGSRRLITVSLLALTASTSLLGWVSQLTLALLLRAIAGIAAAGIFVPGIRLIAKLYPERSGAAIGTLGSSVGAGSLYVSLLAPTLSMWVGWRLTILVLILPGLLILALFAASSYDEPIQGSSTRQKFPTRILREGAIWMLGYQQFARLGVAISLLTWLPTFFASSLGYDVLFSGLALALLSGVSIISNPIGGILADRIRSHSRVTALSFSVMAAALMSIALFALGLTAWLLIIIAGWFAFAYFGPMFAILPRLFGVEVAGLASGFQNMLASIGGILVPFLFGYLRDVTGAFVVPWVFLALMCIAGFLVGVPLMRLESGMRKTKGTSQV